MESVELEHILNLGNIIGYVQLHPGSIIARVLNNDDTITELAIQQRIAENDELESPLLYRLKALKRYLKENPESQLVRVVNQASAEINYWVP